VFLVVNVLQARLKYMHLEGHPKRHTQIVFTLVKLVLYNCEDSHVVVCLTNHRSIRTSSVERPVRSGKEPNAGGPPVVVRAEAAKCCALSCVASTTSSMLPSVLAFEQTQKLIQSMAIL